MFIAGTKDFPADHTDDSKLPFDDTLNITKRGRDADAYDRSHHEIDTVIGRSLGAAVALSLEKQYKKEGNNPYGIIQSKSFGSPTVSGKISNLSLKNIVKDEITTAGAASGLAIGASDDGAIGFSYGGLLSGLGADIGKKYQAILLIGLQKVRIHHLTELDILVILFLCLTSTVRLVCLQWVSGGK